jgi:aspartate/tyrosine/aromatic aminotransferase
VQILKSEYHIYLLDNGRYVPYCCELARLQSRPPFHRALLVASPCRISLAGLTESNVEYVANAIRDVVMRVPVQGQAC